MVRGKMGFDDGSVQVRNIRDPGQPTVKEHQEHMTTHRPCRSWCKFCVMGRLVSAPHRRSDAQDDLEGVPDVSMDDGFLGERNRKSRCLLCWSSANGDTRRREPCWFRERERSSLESQREQRGSLINWDTTGSRSDVTTSQRLKRWQREIGQARQEGSQTVPERPPVGGQPVQWSHRTCGRTRCRSAHNIESCLGASQKNQLAGRICCVPVEQV